MSLLCNNQLFSKLNSITYINYEWTMQILKMHMNQIIIIIILQKLDQTDLFSNGIIGNQTKILLIIGRKNKWKIIKKFLT